MGKIIRARANLYNDSAFTDLYATIPNYYLGIAVGDTTQVGWAKITSYDFFVSKLNSGEFVNLGFSCFDDGALPEKWDISLYIPLCNPSINASWDTSKYLELIFSDGSRLRTNGIIGSSDDYNLQIFGGSYYAHVGAGDIYRYFPNPTGGTPNLYRGNVSTLVVSAMNSDGTIPATATGAWYYLNATYDGSNLWGGISYQSASDIAPWVTLFNANAPAEPVDPYSEIDGESDLIGDTVAIPGDPALSVTSTGIVGLFSPTSQQMQDLADFMWTDFGGTGTTVEDILGEIVQALKRSISNPLDYVIGLNIIPSQGLSKGSSKVIRFGFMSSGVSMPELNSQFFTVDCGSISFDYLCGNTFLDYAPYSKFSIYLPYIGVKEVDANDFVGHTIGVKYKGDVVTGGLTAFITKDGSVMYQYSGSCALNIPLTADNWGSTISAAINVATAVISAASMPGAGLAASAAKAGKAAVGATVSNVAANPSLLSPQVSRSGAISGGAGAIGVQHPYVIREAVRFHSTSHFNTLTGYPSYYFRSLADVTGYTVVYDCHLENVPATDGEIREIEQLLESGVIL